MKIKVLDTTLRDGEQTPGVALTLDDKIAIAQKLDEIGVDIIEAGAAITSNGERECLKRISELGLNAEIASFARTVVKDVDLAIDNGVDCVFLVLPTSDTHIRDKLNTNREDLLKRMNECILHVKERGAKVDLCCEDGSRTSVDFLKTVLERAQTFGADRFTVADTVGVMTPFEISPIFSELSKVAKIPLGVHCHNDLGMAVANTISAVRSGATVVNVTANGLGERAGNAPLEETAVALNLKLGYETNIQLSKLQELSKFVEKTTKIPLAHNKPIVGKNAFSHEAGIHVDGILKNPSTYEAINPALVGAKRLFVLGKQTGVHSVKNMLNELKINASEEQILTIFKKVKEIGDKGKHVTSVDLENLANDVMGRQKKELVKVNELVAVCGNKFTPTASVKMSINGKELITSGTGTGPVDAAMNAIMNATKNISFQLLEYHVDSISGGTDAVVRVEVKVSSSGKIVSAQGTESDIVLASVSAFVNALNTIANLNA